MGVYTPKTNTVPIVVIAAASDAAATGMKEELPCRYRGMKEEITAPEVTMDDAE